MLKPIEIFYSFLICFSLFSLINCGPSPDSSISSNITGQRIVLSISGMTCSSCDSALIISLENLSGIKKANADYKKTTNNVKIIYDKNLISKTKIINHIKNMGYIIINQT